MRLWLDFGILDVEREIIKYEDGGYGIFDIWEEEEKIKKRGVEFKGDLSEEYGWGM